MTPGGILKRGSGAVARGMLRVVARRTSARTVPVQLARAARRLSIGADSLVPPSRPVDGGSIRDRELAGMLAGMELGVWSLGPEAITFVGELVAKLRPRTVLEFAYGISTLAIAHFLAISGRPADQVRVIALEQDPDYAATSRELLARNGLGEYGKVIYAPLTHRAVEGRDSIMYDLSDEVLSMIRDRPPELILVDGPAAGEGGRFATVPLVASLAGGAAFVMDDAMRDSELAVARDWERLRTIRIAGIAPIEKGLLIGHVLG
jgi:hypothetical protein